MATKRDVLMWCYKLGKGTLEQSGVEVKVEVKTQPAEFSGFEIRLCASNGKEEVFDLTFKDANRCITRGDCGIWKKQLNNAIDAALSGVDGTPEQ